MGEVEGTVEGLRWLILSSKMLFLLDLLPQQCLLNARRVDIKEILSESG